MPIPRIISIHRRHAQRRELVRAGHGEAGGWGTGAGRASAGRQPVQRSSAGGGGCAGRVAVISLNIIRPYRTPPPEEEGTGGTGRGRQARLGAARRRTFQNATVTLSWSRTSSCAGSARLFIRCGSQTRSSFRSTPPIATFRALCATTTLEGSPHQRVPSAAPVSRSGLAHSTYGSASGYPR